MTDKIEAINSNNQGTIKQAISFQGRGLHTGKKSSITIHPAEENTGIIFKRVDKAGKGTEILAHWKNTIDLPLCTTIASPDKKIYVRTIEHLMAAFYACGIDNALIEVNGTEIPIMDGSALAFVEKIDEAGIKTLPAPRKVFIVTKPLTIDNGYRKITIEPADTLNIHISTIIRELGKQSWHGDITPNIFKEEISQARTFGHFKDGLLAQLTRFTSTPVCLGANRKNVIALGKNAKILNKEGLRYPDELIKHRLLDLMGDLMLSGGHIQGKITTVAPVHRLTHELLYKTFQEAII